MRVLCRHFGVCYHGSTLPIFPEGVEPFAHTY